MRSCFSSSGLLICACGSLVTTVTRSTPYSPRPSTLSYILLSPLSSLLAALIRLPLPWLDHVIYRDDCQQEWPSPRGPIVPFFLLTLTLPCLIMEMLAKGSGRKPEHMQQRCLPTPCILQTFQHDPKNPRARQGMFRKGHDRVAWPGTPTRNRRARLQRTRLRAARDIRTKETSPIPPSRFRSTKVVPIRSVPVLYK